MSFCAGVQARLIISALCHQEPAFAIRSILNFCRKPFGHATKMAKPMPILTQLSALTVTQQWSMVLPFLAGVLAVLKPKRRCLVSQSRCWYQMSLASALTANCPKGQRPPIWC